MTEALNVTTEIKQGDWVRASETRFQGRYGEVQGRYGEVVSGLCAGADATFAVLVRFEDGAEGVMLLGQIKPVPVLGGQPLRLGDRVRANAAAKEDFPEDDWDRRFSGVVCGYDRGRYGAVTVAQPWVVELVGGRTCNLHWLERGDAMSEVAVNFGAPAVNAISRQIKEAVFRVPVPGQPGCFVNPDDVKPRFSPGQKVRVSDEAHIAPSMRGVIATIIRYLEGAGDNAIFGIDYEVEGIGVIGASAYARDLVSVANEPLTPRGVFEQMERFGIGDTVRIGEGSHLPPSWRGEITKIVGLGTQTVFLEPHRAISPWDLEEIEDSFKIGDMVRVVGCSVFNGATGPITDRSATHCKVALPAPNEPKRIVLFAPCELTLVEAAPTPGVAPGDNFPKIGDTVRVTGGSVTVAPTSAPPADPLAGQVTCLRCGGPAGFLGIACRRVGGCRTAEERAAALEVPKFMSISGRHAYNSVPRGALFSTIDTDVNEPCWGIAGTDGMYATPQLAIAAWRRRQETR